MATRLWWVACCCAVVTACGGSTPTGPTRQPTLSRTRFLAFGDSLTAGEVTAPVSGGRSSPYFKMVVIPTASYPSQLLSLAQARYATQAAVLAVTNAGRPGETVQEGAARFPEALAASDADVVLVMEGVNGLSLVGPDLSAEFMRAMVQAARTRGARVFVGSMAPTIAGRQRSQNPADLVAYNAKLQQMALAEDAVYVDLYNTLLPEANSVIGADGLHPTEVGYRRMAEVFFAAIRAALEVR